MNILAVLNQKGGVGKTTTAVTLAHGAALRGIRTLLVDLDSQGNVADSLGLPGAGDLYRWLWDQLATSEVTIEARPGLDVIRSNKTTEALKLALTGRSFREQVISAALADVRGVYGLVILDCAPSIDILQTAAMVASTAILVPARMDQLAVKGIREVSASVSQLSRSGISTYIAGIIPTMMERVTTESQDQLTKLVQVFGRLVWPAVPQDTRCRVATRAGQTIWEYAPESSAVVGFSNGQYRIGGYAAVLDRMLEVCHG